jgi:hypothetical protein
VSDRPDDTLQQIYATERIRSSEEVTAEEQKGAGSVGNEKDNGKPKYSDGIQLPEDASVEIVTHYNHVESSFKDETDCKSKTPVESLDDEFHPCRIA